MTLTQLLQVATQVIFVLVFAVVLRRALIRRIRANIDAALFFGAAALVLNVGTILAVLHVSLGRVGQAIVLTLLLAIPYLFLRLLADYAAVRWWLLRAAEVGLVLSVAVVLIGSNPIPVGEIAFVIVYFAGLEVYSGLRFGALGFRSVGVNRRRMLAVAAGSLFLGLAVAAAGAAALIQPLRPWSGSITEGMALLSALAYFIGFSPPTSLRRFWREPQIRSFVLKAAALSGADDLDEILAELEREAVIAVGGGPANIGLWNSNRSTIEFRDPAIEVPIEASISGRVFTSQKATFTLRRDFPSTTFPLILAGASAQAAAILAAPLTVAGTRLGVLVVTAERVPYFADDDVNLVELLAAQAALVVQTVRRNQAVRRQAGLLDLAHDAILVRASATGAITFWNRGASDLYGWAPSEAIGRVSHELLKTQFPKPLAEIIEEVERVGHWEGELEHETKDGSHLIVASRWALQRDQRGAAIGALEINTDITSEKAAEKALIDANVQLAEASRHKSQFLANMSHELRTPLNAILGFSELLSDDTSGKFDSATRRRFLDQIHNSGKHLLGLINDILDLSKVDAGQMDLHLESTFAAESIETVRATVEPLARTKDITLSTSADPSQRLVVDPGKLKQMLLNLVSNAIKFTPEGGRISIEATTAEGWTDFAVTDTGIGISEADLGRLFIEFQQLDAGLGRRQEGTGLGLALTKRFAALHGGDISVRSRPGKGSTFVLHLPQEGPKSARPATQGPTRIGPVDPSRPLVLVVEDNPEAAELLGRHLDSGGFRMEVARTGPEALAMARDLRPVAITLDILLPEIDGWEVMTRLKAENVTRDIPVVMVTVVDNPALGRALGAVDYFVKPIDGGALLSRLGHYTFTTKVTQSEIRVLVVDDEPANLDLLQALLEPAGFRVIRANGGREAIVKAQSDKPHLILLDLMMPEVSGFDVVEALRSDAGTRDIPIMVLTAKELTADDKRALNGHVAAIFQRKSLAGAELVEWLRGLVSLRTASTPREPGSANASER
jgi:PAS domain S-box-containing protein